MYVAGKSKEIQEKLFKLGYSWDNSNPHNVTFTNFPFLYIDDNKILECGTDMEYFMKCGYKEITAEEILSLELTEPSYRPFKDKEECWNEMLKHQPFGWLKDIESGDYYEILGVCEYTNFQHFAKRYKFADGTPFGIKEE